VSHSNDWRLGVNSGRGKWSRSRSRGAVFISPKPFGRNPSLTGISRDNTGAALGGCTVKLFRTWDDVMIASAVSDGSGSYTLFPASSGPYYLVEYKAGAPDVAGTSRNDLVAV